MDGSEGVNHHPAPVSWRVISFDKIAACLSKMGNRPGPSVDWIPIEWLYHSDVEAWEVIRAAEKETANES